MYEGWWEKEEGCLADGETEDIEQVYTEVSLRMFTRVRLP